ncbi:FtsW/RodA/SpoVE family cell cycle protein [Streptobacillus felis]|uniref:FtsW/RodA/SpoVE family cell cycle protein n=1 Tax=Streptobacillus felis TaxID=1384509 RepID=UPI0008332115|nr:FtsW/RodA/SpoVE family cell cycle protein [Streptobacillus felis]
MRDFFNTKSKKQLITTIVTLVIILTVIGIFNLMSLSSPESLHNTLGISHVSIIRKHLAFLALSIIACVTISTFLNTNLINKYTLYLMIFTILGLLYTTFFGKNVNGARRWIAIGPLTIQFSEFAKLFLVLILAYMIERAYYIRKERLNIYLFAGVYTLTCAVIILASRSFSATVQFMLIFFCMYWFSSVISYKKILWSAFGISILGFLAIFAKSYRASRLNFSNDHVIYAVKSISNGGLFGSGYGNGIARNFYLPEVQTDYIFAGFVDEWGFIGAIVLIIIFFLLIYFIFYSSKFAKSVYDKMIIYGVGFLISNQVILHLGINVNLLPSTGVTLPFISSGGSSLLTVFMGLGLVLRILMEMNENLEEGVIYE